MPARRVKLPESPAEISAHNHRRAVINWFRTIHHPGRRAVHRLRTANNPGWRAKTRSRPVNDTGWWAEGWNRIMDDHRRRVEDRSRCRAVECRRRLRARRYETSTSRNNDRATPATGFGARRRSDKGARAACQNCAHQLLMNVVFHFVSFQGSVGSLVWTRHQLHLFNNIACFQLMQHRKQRNGHSQK